MGDTITQVGIKESDLATASKAISLGEGSGLVQTALQQSSLTLVAQIQIMSSMNLAIMLHAIQFQGDASAMSIAVARRQWDSFVRYCNGES